jgi:hypothetical protein
MASGGVYPRRIVPKHGGLDARIYVKRRRLLVHKLMLDKQFSHEPGATHVQCSDAGANPPEFADEQSG